jgi:hypothetical protein
MGGSWGQSQEKACCQKAREKSRIEKSGREKSCAQEAGSEKRIG